MLAGCVCVLGALTKRVWGGGEGLGVLEKAFRQRSPWRRCRVVCALRTMPPAQAVVHGALAARQQEGCRGVWEGRVLAGGRKPAQLL